MERPVVQPGHPQARRLDAGPDDAAVRHLRRRRPQVHARLEEPDRRRAVQRLHRRVAPGRHVRARPLTVLLQDATATSAAEAVGLAQRRWGKGPRRALLLHGLGSAGIGWWRIAESLARDGYAVCAPDLRGHGISPKPGRYGIADYAGDLAPLE